MRLKTIKIVLVAGPMTLCVLGAAAAQTGGSILRDPPAASVEASREVDVPPPQQLAAGQQSLARMEQGAQTVRNALEQARAARDVVKTLCLSDKLNQLDVAIRSGKERLLSLKSAVESSDKDRSRHELMILLALRDRGTSSPAKRISASAKKPDSSGSRS